MNKLLYAILALGFGTALTGCANTLSGAKQDAATDTAKTQQAADQAGQAVKSDAQAADQAVAKVPQNAEANALRLPIKTAIDADVVLRDPRNLISVSGSPLKITLTGHVADASMKQRAEEDAQAVLKKHPGYTISNELIVAGAGQ